MKKYLLFIAVLLSSISKTYSCGYSPYGEDVRFSLLSPEYLDYQDFSPFYYHANLFGFDNENQTTYESNIYDWYNYTNKKVAIDEIFTCLTILKYTDININSTNQFVQYLYKNKRSNVIQYLLVAKKCEDFNSVYANDTWERNESLKLDYQKLLNDLNKYIKNEKENYIKIKYAFLAIRVSYYCEDYRLINTLFNEHFAKEKKDYLYYWALYFNSFQSKNTSIDIANVMANSPEKRYACYYYFHKQFNLEQSLTKVKSKNDIANLYAFSSLQRLEPNLDYLKVIYKNSSNSRILDFLLLREINKIEDWVYTPYYTNYLPSVEFANNNDINSTETLRSRSEKDRIYAKKVLEFITNINYSKIKDSVLWKVAEIQLLFITRDYNKCLTNIESFEKGYKNEKVYSQIEKIKALCFISNQEKGNAIITEKVKPIIIKYLKDQQFLFSLGRELEYRGNLIDGIALISYVNQSEISRYENFYTSSIEWQGNRLKHSGNLNYFYKYFDYLDFVYNANDLQKVIDQLNSKSKNSFHKIIYKQLLNDKNYLTDLLGTKYIRENRLSEANKTFASIGLHYWEENYNSWERDKYQDYYTFDKNPFYDIKYTDSFIPHRDKYIVTKLSVTQHLIQYIALANDSNSKDRDYYYFIIGNCYLNMSKSGHSWMMRRYSSYSNYYENVNESYIDELEYRNNHLAQKYYHMAYKHAKNEKFKALCLRMEDYAEKNINSNYNKLKSIHPEYFDDLSNCENLEEYFKARR